MKRFFVGLTAAFIAFFASISTFSQAVLVKDGRATGRIIYTDTADLPAVRLLQDFVERISCAHIPVVAKAVKPSKGDVVFRRPTSDAVREDGFRLSTEGGYLTIEGGKGHGAEYAVVTLLERWLGVDYLSEFDVIVPVNETISLPLINLTDNPAFRYRQSQNYALRTDPLYRTFMRLEEPADEFADGMWVHTFNRLLPSDVYGKTHPEYYAYFNGARHPGRASQWCLTNDEVFEVVAARIDSIFKANPEITMISVSQNDGNHTNCTCEACAEIDAREGSPSGSIIYFLNRLAERFPDKQFSTLAYLYTMHPPKHIKPLPNVNIMLCDIDCYREVPLQYNASGQDFMKALEGWSKISDNIFVWDYGINFDGYATPFPNWHIIQPNIQTFRDNHVKMHFSQISGSRGGDMSELRTYLVSKLMWNPDANVDSIMSQFCRHYYGPAAPYMEEYLSKLNGALIGSRIPLWIYDSPVTHAEGMLNPTARREYNRLFDKAEAAVAADSALLSRVQRSRLSLQYSELELERTNPNKDVAAINRQLDTFEERANRLKLEMINERNNKPQEYVDLYRTRYMPVERKNLAAGRPVSFSETVPAPYDKIAPTALTDGLFGGATYKDSWVGWEGKDVTLTVDLGEVMPVSYISADFLHQLGAWILLPKSVTFSTSVDGKTFTGDYRAVHPEDSEPRVKFVELSHRFNKPVEARYVRLNVEGTKMCPGWHYGVGNPCWFFLDEITVN